MNFKNVTALIPFGKKKEIVEYFFALNISSEKLTCALWTIEDKRLKIIDISSDKYSAIDEIISKTDRLLDQVLGVRDLDPQRILFGVPSSWLADENLKEEKIKILRTLVKELELTPMAYVENSHALIHFLEKTDGIPPTSILVEFESHHLTVTVVRAGKLDGVKIVGRGENSGSDIEKALFSFAAVETLPSKILIYGQNTSELKNQLLSYPWMSKLSFLHFPKIDTLPEDIEIKSVCFAGASEIETGVSYADKPLLVASSNTPIITKDNERLENLDSKKEDKNDAQEKIENIQEDSDNLGFMVGDISEKEKAMEEQIQEEPNIKYSEEIEVPDRSGYLEVDDFEANSPVAIERDLIKPEHGVGHQGINKTSRNLLKAFSLKRILPIRLKNAPILVGIIIVIGLLVGAFLVLPKAEVKIFVEPKILERDTTVTADPNQKLVDEANKIIPGQVVTTDVSGNSKENASGQKEIGNPAKGTVVIYNKTFESKTLSKGTVLSGSNGIKFSLDSSVNIASQSASDSGITFGKANGSVTASAVGPDSNLPSGSELGVGGFSSQQVSAKAEGNFSGGTSKQVTVVSSDDQGRLLASLASTLRKQAQQQLQEKLPEKKILEEALREEIVKKSFNKNIGDQASEFSLNLTNRYRGTAFEDKDLKSIVSKLVVTQVPDGFKLNLEDTETQADVSKVEKDGKLVFLARFKAKLLPNIDSEKVKEQIKGKDINEALNTIKGMENILGAEIKISPSIPFLQRLPIMNKNIQVEVGLK